MPLTKRQKEILDFLEEFQNENGYSPSFEEIARHFGYTSLATVHEHLENLRQKGYIRKSYNASRSIELVPAAVSASAVELPLYGNVAAGEPIEALTDTETIAVPEDMLRRRGNHYVLRVRGDSMKDAGILDGDLLAVKKVAHANDGDIIVARIDDDVTVKTLRRGNQPDQLELLPQNPGYEPIVVDLKKVQFAIEGLAVGVIRTRL